MSDTEHSDKTDTAQAITERRLNIAANGFSVIPNVDKGCYAKGWPKFKQDEDTIRSWERTRRYKATGIRLDNDLAVLDIDVEDEEVVKDIERVVETLLEDFEVDLDTVMIRDTTAPGRKSAWFFRTTEKFGRFSTPPMLPPGSGEEDAAFAVECFGGLSMRQFGAFGPHNAEQGTEYVWDGGPNPETHSIKTLPVLTPDQFEQLILAARDVLEDHDYERVEVPEKAQGPGSRVDMLTDEMEFHTALSGVVKLEDLHLYEGDRCSASWLEGAIAQNTSRCRIHALGDVPYIYDHQTEKTYWPSVEARMEELAEKLNELTGGDKPPIDPPNAVRVETLFDTPDDPVEPARDDDGALLPASEQPVQAILPSDEHAIAVEKAVRLYAYYPPGQGGVLPFGAMAMNELMSMRSFETLYAANSDINEGPRGGQRIVTLATGWKNHHSRVVVHGLGMAPDRPYPMYTEDGKHFINTYRAPNWSEPGGSIEPFLQFMEHLVPNHAEREWFLDWMSYKARHPWMPGAGVVIVSPEHGTGRGTLLKMLEHYWGPELCESIPYPKFIGTDGGGRFAQWRVKNVLVTVDEGSEDSAGGQYQFRRAAYDRLKDIISPEPRNLSIELKGKDAFRVRSHASYLICTNDRNAIPLEEGDRRVAVLLGGLIMSEAMVELLHGPQGWLSPANIAQSMAALHNFFMERNTGAYSPTARAPMFRGKMDMVESAKSDASRLADEFFDGLKGEVFTKEHLVSFMQSHPTDLTFGPHTNIEHVSRLIMQQRCTQLRDANMKPIKVDMASVDLGGGRKLMRGVFNLYTRSNRLAEKWEAKVNDRAGEMKKNGDPRDGSGVFRAISRHLKSI